MLKIQAYQKQGIKTDELINEFEFCCWEDLFNWLKGFTELHRCPKCNKKSEKKALEEYQKKSKGDSKESQKAKHALSKQSKSLADMTEEEMIKADADAKRLRKGISA